MKTNLISQQLSNSIQLTCKLTSNTVKNRSSKPLLSFDIPSEPAIAILLVWMLIPPFFFCFFHVLTHSCLIFERDDSITFNENPMRTPIYFVNLMEYSHAKKWYCPKESACLTLPPLPHPLLWWNMAGNLTWWLDTAQTPSVHAQSGCDHERPWARGSQTSPLWERQIKLISAHTEVSLMRAASKSRRLLGLFRKSMTSALFPVWSATSRLLCSWMSWIVLLPLPHCPLCQGPREPQGVFLLQPHAVWIALAIYFPWELHCFRLINSIIGQWKSHLILMKVHITNLQNYWLAFQHAPDRSL